MCSSKVKAAAAASAPDEVSIAVVAVARINGRPVLQPACNRVPTLDRRNPLKKNLSPKSPRPPLLQPPLPISPPKSKSPRPPSSIKRGSEINSLCSSSEKFVVVVTTPPRSVSSSAAKLERNKSKKTTINATAASSGGGIENTTNNNAAAVMMSYSSSMIMEAPGSIAAVRREHVALQQAQRKMRIAHYGRTKSGKFEAKITPFTESSTTLAVDNGTTKEKRCSFITPNSDPLYVAYHDEEWGVPVHDDKMLFELLVVSGAQVGSDWTSILKKREDFRNVFSGFDAETVASFTERQITSASADYGIDLSRVRGVVDNSIRILEIKRAFGSFDKYVWGFVNHKPISTQYKSAHKIPVKTSKSESISKDMVRRGFRSVGPTVVHSFMQAAGLTNDHLLSCHRHHH